MKYNFNTLKNQPLIYFQQQIFYANLTSLEFNFILFWRENI
jgi:hypothetical protein